MFAKDILILVYMEEKFGEEAHRAVNNAWADTSYQNIISEEQKSPRSWGNERVGGGNPREGNYNPYDAVNNYK